MFEFKVNKSCQKSRARTASFKLLRGEVKTPMFMPCGTKGMVKGMLPHELDEMGVQLILGNTYHLGHRPGPEIIKESGRLHKFMDWPNNILTDSGL